MVISTLALDGNGDQPLEKGARISIADTGYIVNHLASLFLTFHQALETGHSLGKTVN